MGFGPRMNIHLGFQEIISHTPDLFTSNISYNAYLHYWAQISSANAWLNGDCDVVHGENSAPLESTEAHTIAVQQAVQECSIQVITPAFAPSVR